jgi:recombining binding protein suppressor of hairless
MGYVVAKFQYTFFDAFGQNNNIPDVPITPFPTLFTAPIYRTSNNTVELTVSNFFYEDPKTRTQVPLDIYLGNLGPLRHRVYQASPPGLLTNTSSFMQSVTQQHMEASGSTEDPGSPQGTPSMAGAPRYMASGPLHTIVIVEMPTLVEVMKALEEDALPVNQDTASGNQSHQNDPSTSNVPHDSRNSSGVPPPPPPPITARSLPLLFIRASDGVGYHSGRTVACENVFETMGLPDIPSPTNGAGSIDTGWLTASQATAAIDGSYPGWTLRVM